MGFRGTEEVQGAILILNSEVWILVLVLVVVLVLDQSAFSGAKRARLSAIILSS